MQYSIKIVQYTGIQSSVIRARHLYGHMTCDMQYAIQGSMECNTKCNNTVAMQYGIQRYILDGV